MESHGGDIELLGLEGDVARLRLQGSCEGCPASSATLELAVKSALEEAAPDLQGIEVEGAVESQPAGRAGDLGHRAAGDPGRARRPLPEDPPAPPGTS